MPRKHQAPSSASISQSQRLTRWATLGACLLLVTIIGGRLGLGALGLQIIPGLGLVCLGLSYLAALTLLVRGTAYILKGLGKIPQPDGARNSTLVLLTTGVRPLPPGQVQKTGWSARADHPVLEY
ncbi:hypothetical protein [Rothia nasimurium]|uniref:hypothetical protein n=1 Tax=Rothia nasimurium TaxID=85336 RepID=UPI001626741D|nr:hypothetical protein [Rothia nasimurium]